MTLQQILDNPCNPDNPEDAKYLDKLKEKIVDKRTLKEMLPLNQLSNKQLKALQKVISEVIKECAFEEQPNAICAINRAFGTESLWTKARSGRNQSDRIVKPQFSAIETYVRLLRDLQGGEDPTAEHVNRRCDIAEKYGISENALDGHLSALQDGQNILGSKVRIGYLRRGTNNYDSTIHPFFLALNLSEVYLLTVALKGVLADSPFAKDYQNILADLYRQLSSYAKDKIDAFAQRDGVELFDGKPCDKYDRGYRAEEKEDPGFLLKSGRKCVIQFTDEIPRKRVGTIHTSRSGGSFEFHDDEGAIIPLDRESNSYILLSVL